MEMFEPEDEVDTSNYQLVSRRGDEVIILAPRLKMTEDEALLHAAWLLVMSGDDEEKFQKIVRAVKNT